jgi:CDP-diacylglycerol--serine O-phosphatidyltransferase
MKMLSPMRRWEDQLPPEQKRRMRRGMYILPSLFTALNIGAGYYAITETMRADAADLWRFDHAALAIGFAVFFDGLDGRIARMTNTTSDFGREFDSLADVITFGVAPALLAWMWGFRWLSVFGPLGLNERLVSLGIIATFLFVVAGASRLARFNIQANPKPSNPGRPGRKYFVGLPIPAAAAVLAATIHLLDGRPIQTWWMATVWLVLLIFAAFLMVSTWRFYSFKDLNLRNRHPVQLMLLIAAFVALLRFFSGPVLFVMSVTYMFSGVFMRATSLVRKRPTEPDHPVYEEAPQPR